MGIILIGITTFMHTFYEVLLWCGDQLVPWLVPLLVLLSFQISPTGIILVGFSFTLKKKRRIKMDSYSLISIIALFFAGTFITMILMLINLNDYDE